ncbi:MAG: hypothetical protein M0005_02685 [Actinomycetota bacterium]|nr:hypothetical protein [Actinomycetota bacterium]
MDSPRQGKYGPQRLFAFGLFVALAEGVSASVGVATRDRAGGAGAGR